MTVDMASKSPFPGMDPWLEQQWGDVHHRLITYSGDTLQGQLPGDLVARLEERVFLETPWTTSRQIVPDVQIVETPERPRTPGTRGVAGVAEPLVLQFPGDPVTEGYIEIREAGSANRIVTIIEILSPSNKMPGPGMDLYRKKQDEVLGGFTSLVEIDLLRSGQRITLAHRIHVPPSHRTPYHISVRRGWRPNNIELYAIPLSERLPVIRIPLRQEDQDAHLDLQELFDRAYVNGRYDHTDYTSRLDPSLDPADVAWAEGILREEGLLKSA
ncbi:MAG TPA: DUF4058 family protein [Tepidisphaeraceae bacterium]|jgi:hypothetical protein|nr:DUF4058 family protein [Tepidisphaeraceae bacterium]